MKMFANYKRWVDKFGKLFGIREASVHWPGTALHPHPNRATWVLVRDSKIRGPRRAEFWHWRVGRRVIHDGFWYRVHAMRRVTLFGDDGWWDVCLYGMEYR